MKKNTKKLANLLKQLKNSLAPETTEQVRAAFDEAIAEAEASEDELSLEDVTTLITEKLKGLATVDEVTQTVEALENRFKNGGKEFKNYLQTKKSMTDFYQTIKNNNRETFRSEWKKVILSNDIDPDGVLLPAPVVKAITDGLSKAGKFFPLLNHTGLKSLKIPVNQMNEDDDDSRAGKHTKGTTKKSQVWNLVPKNIVASVVYKLLAVDYETLRSAEDESALLQYITTELVDGWVREIERAILVGDGRNVSDTRHITSFETLLKTVSDPFTTVSTIADIEFATIEEIKLAIDNIESEGDIILVVSKQQKTKLQGFVAAAGATQQYVSDEILAGQLGVSQIVTNRNVKAANGVVAIAFVAKDYDVVGDTTPERIEQYDIYKNQNVFEMVGMAGGGLAKLKSSVVLLPGAEE